MKQFKLYFAILLLALVIPSFVLAAWWNPFSWSIWSVIFHKQEVTTQIQTQNQIDTQTENATQNNSTDNNQPPAEAISACKGKANGDSCSFSDKGNTTSGTCDTKPGILACAPNKSGDNLNSKSNTNTNNNTNTNTSSNTNTNNKTSVTLPVAANSCINNTKDNPQCKDCCDCLSGVDGAIRTSCRDTCATHDFSKNSNFITVSALSKLGANGNYTQCTAKTNSAECKICCEGSMGLSCGDYQYCRTACNNKFGTTPGPTTSNQQQTNNQNSGGGQEAYTITQAISDQAQLNTMAFGGLGFMTGNTCSDSFLPPGKVADFFGFQYLRDITANGKGHDTDFVTNSANNVLKTLNSTQKSQMLALAKSQADSVNQFAYDRFPLMVAFRRQMTGDIPSGTTGLSKSAVMSYSADLYALDAQISIQRAKLYASVLNSLDSTQKAFLDGMVKGGFASWASLPNQVDAGLSRNESVLMMTYASEMFGWYAGDLEADTYFCPERQADYFGGFYIKDAPAIGNAGYTIDESITGDQGQAFLNALNTTQKSTITSVITTQKTALNGIVDKRRAISTQLRNALNGGTINEATVISLSREYGSYDGEISYYYAMAFSSVYNTLTTAQKTTLTNLRGLSSYPCPATSAYLYSEKISMPSVASTDFLFK